MNKQLEIFLYLVQGAGVIFYCIFSAAYILPFPSMTTLSGEPIFRLLLLIFGGLFLILTIATIVLSALLKQEKANQS